MNGLQVITVSRKPLSEGSVAANVLKHGTGALHIDAARIQSDGEVITTNSRSPEASAKENRNIYGEYGPLVTHQTPGQKLGRWPNNLILASEEIAQDIDAQSGVTKSSGGRAYQNTNDMYSGGWSHKGEGVAQDPGYGDVGGAARYFKQIRGDGMADIPQDLIDYLYTMITPTHIEGETLIVLDPSAVDWSEYEDEQFHGLIARSPAGGDPSPFIDEMWRVVKPGAHVLLIAHEDEPTGHTGACALEDKGFEIRDAILVAQEAGHLHYVPKAPKKERHAGCAHLTHKRKGAPVYDLDEDAEGYMETIIEVLQEAGVDEEAIDNMAEEGLPRNVIPKSVRQFFHKREDDERAPGGGNNHPTVKPKDVLVRLLADVPKDATVLDPFMGSGSMGLACMETGHSYIGIEKEPEYLEIADARVRHWDKARAGWVATEIESDHKPESAPEEQGSLGLDDLFGF